MKRFVLTLVAALALTLSLAGAATASTDPADPNCVGVTAEFMAQRGQELGFPGIGNDAKYLFDPSLSVKELFDTKIFFHCDSA